MRRLGVLAAAALVLAVGANAAGDGAEVTIPDKLFAPGELDVLVGTPVTWRNADSRSHTVSSEDEFFDSGYLGPGTSFSHVFPATGAFRYLCRIHRSMRGVVRVYALILTGPPRPLPPGWAVSFRGVSPAAGAPVALERISRGSVSVVARTTAAADGTFVFTQRPTGPGRYRARGGEAVSPLVPVAVKPSVTVGVGGGRVRVETAPARPRSAVLLQSYDRDHFAWTTVAKGRLDRSSRTSLAVPVGPARLRVVVRGSSGWADGVSRTVVLAR